MRSVVLFCLFYLFVVTSDVLGQKRRDHRKGRHNRIRSDPAGGHISGTWQRRTHGNHETNRGNTTDQRQNTEVQRGGRYHQQGQNSRRDQRKRKGQHKGRRHRKDHSQPIDNQEPTVSPQVDVLETIIIPAVCKECKRKDPTHQSCIAICPDLATDDSGRGATFLGDSYCYFCEYYRFNRSYYQQCRSRFCTSKTCINQQNLKTGDSTEVPPSTLINM
ncbi:uncharacterized protein LOC133174032 [Saccostrea echinata]|uniref:uncharacterized protein LOC133174032 n=1 Tax=Saccostrea echinata TaxID=191078 RepID=UPI002A8042F6|nr:uncharacterized protein LOC133174032 [Saccostrea echinata]